SATLQSSDETPEPHSHNYGHSHVELWTCVITFENAHSHKQSRIKGDFGWLLPRRFGGYRFVGSLVAFLDVTLYPGDPFRARGHRLTHSLNQRHTIDRVTASLGNYLSFVN